MMMNEVQRVSLEMYRGDTLAFTARFPDLAEDFTALNFTIKKIPTAGTPLVALTLGDGITKVDDGLYTVRVVPSDTASFPADTYQYDFQVTEASGDVWTLMGGPLRIVQDVTN